MKVRLNENELKHIIEESVKRLLKEYYRGPIYHATNIYGLYYMSLNNTLEPSSDWRGLGDGYDEKRHVNYDEFISFTRDKNFNIARNRGQVSCILTFDSEKLMKLRKGRLYPVNWENCKSNTDGYNEAEERFYIDKVHPLSEYVEKIEIIINENELCNDNSITDFAAYGDREKDDDIYAIYEKFEEEYEDEEELLKNFNMYFINLILKSPLGNKISIINI